MKVCLHPLDTIFQHILFKCVQMLNMLLMLCPIDIIFTVYAWLSALSSFPRKQGLIAARASLKQLAIYHTKLED